MILQDRAHVLNLKTFCDMKHGSTNLKVIYSIWVHILQSKNHKAQGLCCKYLHILSVFFHLRCCYINNQFHHYGLGGFSLGLVFFCQTISVIFWLKLLYPKNFRTLTNHLPLTVHTQYVCTYILLYIFILYLLPDKNTTLGNNKYLLKLKLHN